MIGESVLRKHRLAYRFLGNYIHDGANNVIVPIYFVLFHKTT